VPSVMPEALSNHESKQWDAVYGDVKFLVLRYKLRDSWGTKESAEQAIIQCLEYMGKATDEYWVFIRTLRLMTLTGEQLRTPLPDDVRRVIKRFDRTLFRKSYQPYLSKFWNLQFLSKRQQAKKATNSPYKKWNWFATQNALKAMAASRPNTFRHVLAFYEEQAKDMLPLKPPAVTRLLRYMRDIEFDLEAA
jgi:hypothetical protein